MSKESTSSIGGELLAVAGFLLCIAGALDSGSMVQYGSLMPLIPMILGISLELPGIALRIGPKS